MFEANARLPHSPTQHPRLKPAVSKTNSPSPSFYPQQKRRFKRYSFLAVQPLPLLPTQAYFLVRLIPTTTSRYLPCSSTHSHVVVFTLLLPPRWHTQLSIRTTFPIRSMHTLLDKGSYISSKSRVHLRYLHT